MNQFTASNGIGVRLDGRDLDIKNTLDWMGLCGGHVVDALREFFRAEEDDRLERWRFPELPWLLVYHWGQPTSAGVVVLDEGSGATSRVIHRDADPDNESPDYRAARAYFEAHPEPKPWHDAKPGEVWVLTVVTGPTFDEVAMRVLSGSDGPRFFPIADEDGMTYGRRSNEITAGRRIYPEVTE